MFKSGFYILVFAIGLLLRAVSVQAAGCNIDVINPATYTKILDYLLISKSDVKYFKRAFNALAQNDYKEADKFLKKTESNIIMGHVLAEKYLTTNYQSKYSELADWLHKYNDLPMASKIYRLAKKKAGSNDIKKLTLPKSMPEGSYIQGWKNADIEHLNAADRKYLVQQVSKFRKSLNQGKTKAARTVLEQKRFRMVAPDKYWDDMAATLAMKYFVDNYNTLSWTWGAKAAKRGTSGTGAWVAGLTAWRQAKYKDAAKYFDKLASSGNDDEWLVSAGGYWGYRAYAKLKNSVKAKQMLRLAAKYKHTFYGILAAFKLGEPLTYNWDAVSYLNNFDTYDYVYELLASPAIRRAVILIHAKRPDLAEQELRFGFNDMTDKQQETTIYIANQFGMHSLAIYACNRSKNVDENQSYDGIAYPIPGFIPASGWRVDKALVLALVRQESSFKPEAKSPAGARGLMQLMPNTAYHITKDASLKKDKTRLLDAQFNLDLGQRYVDYLMAKPFIEGNLFYMMAAYNGGPGNLLKWKKDADYKNDPLLFIETIPSAETRVYIERVMANYWIYNSRFGLPNPTLQQIAEGKWPVISRK